MDDTSSGQFLHMARHGCVHCALEVCAGFHHIYDVCTSCLNLYMLIHTWLHEVLSTSNVAYKDALCVLHFNMGSLIPTTLRKRLITVSLLG